MEARPVELNFATGVRVTVVSGFLAACGPLLADPQAHINLVTYPNVAPLPSKDPHRQNVQTRTGDAIMQSKRLGSTGKKLFTQHPTFEEAVKATIPYSADKRQIVVEIEDSNGDFLGQAVLPFSLTAPSREQSKRLMLCPRNTQYPDDPLFKHDMNVLSKFQQDDFGHIVVHWEVILIPFGGIPNEMQGHSRPTSSALPPFPIGCTVKAQWLTSASAGGGSSGMAPPSMGTQYTTLIDFGEDQPREVESTAPIFVALHQKDQLRTVNFTCKMQQGLHGEPSTAEVFIQMPRPTESQMNRDVQWACPVVTAAGEDWGVLIVSLRLTPKPIDPQTLTQQKRKDWGRPDPDCPIAAYTPIEWLSNEHIARSTERRWRSACINDAKPSSQHVRHVLEVTMGRIALDPNVGQLVSAFFNKAPTSVTPEELKQLLISLTFGDASMSIKESCRFAFVALRKEMEEAIKPIDVEFILENCLLPRTLDMPKEEIHRRTDEIFRGMEYVTWEEFEAHFINNFAQWYTLGVPIEHGSVANTRPYSSKTMHAGPSGKAEKEAAAAEQPPMIDEGETDPWRSFAVRFLKTGRAFTVTAHVEDTFETVASMLEDSVGLPPSRQTLSLDGRVLEPRHLVGQFIYMNQEREITIVERDETITLQLVHRQKNKQWVHKMHASDKVLKLRSHVQQKTMIPLTRVVLSVGDQQLWDRHSIDHYRLADGAVINISSSN